MNQRMLSFGLFAIALGLFAVAWSIYDNTQRHGRYVWSAPFRFDTLTGGIELCRGDSGMAMCERWDNRLSPE